MIALTPSQAAQIHTSINTVSSTLALMLTDTSYNRGQVSQARLALTYYSSLSKTVDSLVTTTTQQQYIVGLGDTLHTIAQSQLGDATEYKAIMLANGINNQNIVPGQVLNLPVLINQ